ncbi:MAG: hypothetical protein ACREIQ_03220 [Nitrospiria bacterium]
MTTTALTVELLVIGYQALIWLGLAACLFPLCDEALLRALKDWKELLVVGSVVAAYTSGAIVNGVASGIMSSIESKVIYKRPQKPSVMRAAILVRKPDAFVHVMKNFEAPRVLRSAILNMLLIGVFTSAHVYRSTTSTWPQLLLVVLLFVLGTAGAAWAWYETAENFYIHLTYANI